VGKKRCAWRIFVRKKENIVLKWISERYDEMLWTGLIWLRTVTNGGLL
jgi:hypothetical protein